MKVTQTNKQAKNYVQASELECGETILNGAGNVCMRVKSSTADSANKVAFIVLSSGNSYTVDEDCKYERVDAEVIWERRGQ